MAYEIRGLVITLKAGEDLTEKQFHAVKISGDSTVVACGLGDKPVGILQNDPRNGSAAEIMVYGVSRVKIGATMTAGASVTVDATGQVVNETENLTNYNFGQLLENATAGSIGTALINTAVPVEVETEI